MANEANSEFDKLFKEIDAQEEDVLTELEKQKLLEEEKNNRAVYKTFGKFFFFAGVVAIAVAIAERLFNFHFFSGSVYGVSAFMIVIGALLWRS